MKGQWRYWDSYREHIQESMRMAAVTIDWATGMERFNMAHVNGFFRGSKGSRLCGYTPLQRRRNWAEHRKMERGFWK